MSGLLTVAGREFRAFFYAPIAYVVGAAFLALNGFTFWALMKVLSDPNQAAAPGAVLRQFFGGTLLHWLTVFAVASVLSMRSVAEDRSTGNWEALLTTRARASSVIVGKWLALTLFYWVLWGPTLLLIAVFSRYLPSGQAIDMGPVLASYLGVATIGTALLAMGVAVSAATRTQVVAAVGSFSVFLGWLMLGEFDDLGIGFGDAHWLPLLDLRGGLATLARGEVPPVFFLSLSLLVVLSLTLATALATRDAKTRLRILAAMILLALAGGSLSQLVGRHWATSDWSASRVNSLEPSTRVLLESLDEPLEVILVRPHAQVFDSAHKEVARLLDRMQAAQPLLRRHDLDPLAEPERVRKWAFDLAIRPEDLSSGGAVIFQRGTRRRVADLLSMASFASDDLGVGALSGFRAESAFRRAIAEVDAREQERMCSSIGHGELSREGQADSTQLNWSATAARLESDGIELVELTELTPTSLAPCTALLILGPEAPLRAAEVLALEGYMKSGGDLLVALRSRSQVGAADVGFGNPGSGLSLLLDARGVQVLKAAVVDPSAEVEPLVWMTYDGYGAHPIVHEFHQRRATVWKTPVALEATREEVEPLVSASGSSWSETSLAALLEGGHYQRDPEDGETRSVAVASEDQAGSRLVVLGSVEAFAAGASERGIGGNQRLLVAASLWIVDRDAQLAAEDKSPEYLRLIMSERQLQRAFVWCVVAGPAALSILGAFFWWWRRREE